MSQEVKEYKITIYGGPTGWGNSRAVIDLKGWAGNVLTRVKFYDPQMNIPDDEKSFGFTKMNLPTSMFQSVVDILRNEKPIYTVFFSNKVQIFTHPEEVGVGEESKGNQ